jgi:hypothetical protein
MVALQIGVILWIIVWLSYDLNCFINLEAYWLVIIRNYLIDLLHMEDGIYFFLFINFEFIF